VAELSDEPTVLRLRSKSVIVIIASYSFAD